jgi:hypothetical protein
MVKALVLSHVNFRLVAISPPVDSVSTCYSSKVSRQF